MDIYYIKLDQVFPITTISCYIELQTVQDLGALEDYAGWPGAKYFQ